MFSYLSHPCSSLVCHFVENLLIHNLYEFPIPFTNNHTQVVPTFLNHPDIPTYKEYGPIPTYL